jgi:ABC-type branched-subunit amino acid transport system substrate-binding protein
LAAWALKNVGVKVFLTGDDDYLGNEHADFFAAGFERAGGSFTDRIMFSNDPAAISGVIEAARKTKADFIFAAARDEQAAAFLKAVRSAAPALTQPVIGPESLTAYPRTLGLMGEQAAKVRTLTALADAPALIERLKKAGAKDVVYAERAAEGYDIAAVICASLAKAGQGKADIPELVQIVSGVEIDGARGKVSFDKNHEPIVNMVVQEWEFKAGTAQPKTLESLGVSQSLDFGCGRVGFPKKPAPEGEETPRSDWLDE